MTAGARARIFTAALDHNFSRLRELAGGRRVMAAVKGNAYGHGLLTAARAFAAADSLAVARLVEAEALRAGGVRQPIVLLSGVSTAAEFDRAAALACEVVVHTSAQLPLFERAGGQAVVAWLKVDSGMHRLGVAPAAVPALLERLRAAPRTAEVRLMTHLATADEPDDPLGAAQARAFLALTDGFDGAVSVDNSAALLGGYSADAAGWGHRGDTWVRPGVALYGISPFANRDGRDLGLEPAMHFETTLLDVKPLADGERVGYGGRWRASGDTTLGILAAGYADGYSRFLPSGTPVWVNGRRVPLAGIVSMDLAAVDLGPDAADAIGDPVQLWGDRLPAEAVARAAGTIAYQLTTGVIHREPPIVDNAASGQRHNTRQGPAP